VRITHGQLNQEDENIIQRGGKIIQRGGNTTQKGSNLEDPPMLLEVMIFGYFRSFQVVYLDNVSIFQCVHSSSSYDAYRDAFLSKRYTVSQTRGLQKVSLLL
jgi:hypothetical protein